MLFVSLNKVEAGAARFDEDRGREVQDETSKPCVINATSIRCFYARRDGKPGTRITFQDGGGFAVTETPEALAQHLGFGGSPVLAPPVSEPIN